jgi:hypothetical protein
VARDLNIAKVPPPPIAFVPLERSRVRQKTNGLGIVFIAAIATTCFGRAWPSSGHKVDVVHK